MLKLLPFASRSHRSGQTHCVRLPPLLLASLLPQRRQQTSTQHRTPPPPLAWTAQWLPNSSCALFPMLVSTRVAQVMCPARRVFDFDFFFFFPRFRFFLSFLLCVCVCVSCNPIWQSFSLLQYCTLIEHFGHKKIHKKSEPFPLAGVCTRKLLRLVPARTKKKKSALDGRYNVPITIVLYCNTFSVSLRKLTSIKLNLISSA